MRPISIALACLPAAAVLFVEIHLLAVRYASIGWQAALALHLIDAFKTLVIGGLALAPAVIVRRRALGSWIIFAASLLSSLPVFLAARDGMVYPAYGFATGYRDLFELSAISYGVTIVAATLWDLLARAAGVVPNSHLQRMPKSWAMLPGLGTFLALVYLEGRHGFLANNEMLPGAAGWWKLELAASPELPVELALACVLTMAPALIVRRHAHGSAVVCAASLVAGLPILMLVPEWAAKTYLIRTDAGDVGALFLISAFLYGATIVLAVLWDVLAARGAAPPPGSERPPPRLA